MVIICPALDVLVAYYDMLAQSPAGSRKKRALDNIGFMSQTSSFMNRNTPVS